MSERIILDGDSTATRNGLTAKDLAQALTTIALKGLTVLFETHGAPLTSEPSFAFVEIDADDTLVAMLEDLDTDPRIAPFAAMMRGRAAPGRTTTLIRAGEIAVIVGFRWLAFTQAPAPTSPLNRN